jgi:hypothetical protein
VSSCQLELLAEGYIPYKPYKSLKKEIKTEFINPLPFFLSQKDQEMLQEVMVDLALATGDERWFESLTSKYL